MRQIFPLLNVQLHLIAGLISLSPIGVRSIALPLHGSPVVFHFKDSEGTLNFRKMEFRAITENGHGKHITSQWHCWYFIFCKNKHIFRKENNSLIIWNLYEHLIISSLSESVLISVRWKVQTRTGENYFAAPNKNWNHKTFIFTFNFPKKASYHDLHIFY